MLTSCRVFSIFLVVCAATAVAQNTKSAPALTSLVNAELAFARASAEHGMDSAFLAFLADDAIIFRPHPVNGAEWFRSHPAPAVLLNWMPGFADISVTGELGYTTGPWMVREKADTTASPAYGEFVTIWKKKGDAWKVALDMGISHPGSSMGVHFTPPMVGTGPSVLIRPDSGFKPAEWSKLLARERASFGDSLHPVSAADCISSLSPEVHIFRPGHMPIVGSDSVKDFLISQPGMTLRRSLGGDLSRSADLGYTYGSYHTRRGDPAGTMEGYYLTVWKKGGKGEWRIVLDLQSRLPKKQ